MHIFNIISEFRADFAQTQYWADMAATVENSPWHREANVAVHTDMVVDAFLTRVSLGAPASFDETVFASTDLPVMTARGIAVVFLALLFHDTGKPPAREEAYSEERGHYVRFYGHEQMSARIWEDYAVTNWSRLKSTFDLLPEDIYRIGWLIENHLPYDRKGDKLNEVLDTTLKVFVADPDFNNADALFQMIRSDAWGRISDDHDTKKAKVLDWIASTMLAMRERADVLAAQPPMGGKTMTILVGASGSGKSTYADLLTRYGGAKHYSWDTLRIEMAVRDGVISPTSFGSDEAVRNAYRIAFEHSLPPKPEPVAEGQDAPPPRPSTSPFDSFAASRLTQLLRSGEDIVVDNTSTTKKARRAMVASARRAGYRIIIVLFPVSRAMLSARCTSRPDKRVPESAVLRQFDNLHYPMYGSEADLVRVHASNLFPDAHPVTAATEPA